jgi:formylglycine-generating enzyme required for sulfatase activity
MGAPMKLSSRCPNCAQVSDLADVEVGREQTCAACGLGFAPADVPFGTGGRYLLRRWIGAGGMGTVFLARDAVLDRDVALKVLVFPPGRDRSRAEERFRTEIRAASQLIHENICRTYDNGHWEGSSYYTMPFLGGGTLADRIKAAGPHPSGPAAGWIHTAARTMSYAHQAGVVHRDLKPSNLLFDGRETLLITDFGLALFFDDSEATRITQAGLRFGTLPYAPPEQILGEIEEHGPGCDVYALGVVLYELVTGRRPYDGQGRALEDKILAGRPRRPTEIRPEVDLRLERICLKAMARRIRDRYATMHDLAEALAEYLGRPRPAPAAGGGTAPGRSGAGTYHSGPLDIELVPIPPGEFVMGSVEAPDESPPRRVRIATPFFLGVYPVTQRQYREVTGRLPQSPFTGEDRRPADSVSWLDAVVFCNRLSELDGLEAYYAIAAGKVKIVGGEGYRLPTEAEWEYACRAGTSTTYSFGDDPGRLGQYAWFADNSENCTHEVGLLAPNGLGLHDMHGNVWEWCWDWYSPASYRVRHDGAVDPGGVPEGTERALRGGSWNVEAPSLRCAARTKFTPIEFPLYYFGFRLARTRAGG